MASVDDKEISHDATIGVRGKSAAALYCAIAMMVLVSLANLLTTVTLIGVLRLSHDGLAGLEFMPSTFMVRFLENTYIRSVILKSENVTFGGHRNRSFVFVIDENTINIVVTDGSKCKMSPMTVCVDVTNSAYNSRHLSLSQGVELDTELFELYNVDGTKLLFSTDFTKKPITVATMSSGVVQPFMETKCMESDEELNLDSSNFVKLTSGGDQFLESDRWSTIQANNSVMIRVNKDPAGKQFGRITLNGSNVFLDNMEINVVYSHSNDIDVVHKLCVCASNGRLFSVPSIIYTTCNIYQGDINPCEDAY